MADELKKKMLSAREAQSCEQAKTPRCRCRCGGQFHGTKRGNVCDLPLGDPHYPGKNCAACLGSGKCYRCNGTGKVAVAWDGTGQLHACHQCGETGKCWRCGGTGGILRKGARDAAERERTAVRP